MQVRTRQQNVRNGYLLIWWKDIKNKKSLSEPDIQGQQIKHMIWNMKLRANILDLRLESWDRDNSIKGKLKNTKKQDS
jgi:hypothetical protein